MIKKYSLAFTAIMCFTTQIFSQAFNDITWADLTAQHGETINSNAIIVVEPTDRLILTPTCNAEINLNAKGILVYGELVFADSDSENSNCALLTLTTDWILIAQNAAFIAGTEEQPLSNNFQLVLSGSESDEFDLSDVKNHTQHYISTGIVTGTATETGIPTASQLENMVGDDNYSFLMAMGFNARIIMHSSDAIHKKTWVQLQGTVNPDDTKLIFDEDTGWEVGDKIAIASTDFDWNQAEDFTIVGVENNGQTVFINNGLEYMHYGKIETYSNGTRSWDLDMRAEVGLLSRNIKIRGDINYNPSEPLNNQDNQFGGHVMAMMGGDLFISGVEFEHMGQAGKLGRYPAHWHMLVDVRGQYIKNSSFHHTFNKGITIHGTLNALIQDNMVYENIGHSYFFEDGSEAGNQVIGNLAINARKPRTNAEATPDSADFTNTSNFWLENGENTFIGNHAAGSEKRGFHFQLKGMNGISNSREYWGVFTYSREGPTEFIGNAAHSTERALFVDHGTYINVNNYKGTDDAPQVVDEAWHIDDFTAYKAERGAYIRGIGGDLNEVKIAEMKDGIIFRFNQSLNHSLIVGRTPNIGTPDTEEEIAEGRSLPSGNTYLGHQLYDGPGGLNNVHFAGFTEINDFAIKGSNAVHKSTLHYVNKVTFDPATPHRQKLRASSATLESKGVVDIDGSLTGVPGATLVGRLNNKGSREGRFKNLLYAAPDYQTDSIWNVVINPPGYDIGSLKFQGESYSAVIRTDTTKVNGTVVENKGEISTRVVISREDGEETHDFSPGHTVRDQSLFVTNTHHYKITLVNASPSFRLYMNDLPMGEGIIYEIEGLDINFTDFTLDDERKTRLPAVPSMDALEEASTTSVYRNLEEGRLFVKLVAQMRHGFSYPQPRMTLENRQYGGVKVDITLVDFSLSTSENEFNQKLISIYPNPTNSAFKINLKKHKPTLNDRVQIVSTLGQTLLEFDVKQNYNYDISSLNNGLYFVVLKTGGKSIHTSKLIKKN